MNCCIYRNNIFPMEPELGKFRLWKQMMEINYFAIGISAFTKINIGVLSFKSRTTPSALRTGIKPQVPAKFFSK